MNNFYLILSTLLIFCSFGEPSQGPENATDTTGTLLVNVSNVNAIKGDLRLGIYTTADSYNAEDKPEYHKVMAVSNQGVVSVEVDDLPFGKYAIAMIHDVNRNQKMDFNFVGIPKEPYGFSKMKSRFKKPKFSEVQFDFTSSGQKVKVELTEW